MSVSKEEGIAKEEKINLTAQELADLIWLMVQINQSTKASDSQEIPLPSLITQPAIWIIGWSIAPVRAELKFKAVQFISSRLLFSRIVEPEPKPVKKSAPIYSKPPNSQASKSVFVPGLPIKIANPPALRNSLALGRSLRPLMRKVPSLTETVFDEESTVTSIAEVEAVAKDFWLPVFQPVPTRWLEVALVIEETERYPLWRQTLTEFQQLLERHGAFRNVSLWHLKSGFNGEIELYSKKRQASLKELRDPSGKRLIWVVSDCVSAIWHDGSLMKVLRDWARVQPVSLLQLLPERLWPRTALGWGIEVKLYSENPGVPNARLLKTPQPVETQFNSQQALTLPIVTLESLGASHFCSKYKCLE